MEGVRVLNYQTRYHKLTKKLYEEAPDTYNAAMVFVRLDQLQERGCYMVKANKPSNSGTLITFAPVKDAEEYKAELDKIMKRVAELGMEFEKAEENHG